MSSERPVSTSEFFKKLRDVDVLEPTGLATLVAEAGETWYTLDAAAASLEESKKSVLAKYVIEYMDGGVSGKAGAPPKPMSAAQAEQRALCDPRYEVHLDMMIAARKEANLARVRYDMGKMFIELQRSALATKRQEMAMNGESGRGAGRG